MYRSFSLTLITSLNPGPEGISSKPLICFHDRWIIRENVWSLCLRLEQNIYFLSCGIMACVFCEVVGKRYLRTIYNSCNRNLTFLSCWALVWSFGTWSEASSLIIVEFFCARVLRFRLLFSSFRIWVSAMGGIGIVPSRKVVVSSRSVSYTHLTLPTICSV